MATRPLDTLLDSNAICDVPADVHCLTLQFSAMSTLDSIAFVPWNVWPPELHVFIICLLLHFCAWSHRVRFDTSGCLQIQVTLSNSSWDHSATYSTRCYLKRMLSLQQPGVSSHHQALADVNWYLRRKEKRRRDWDPSLLPFPTQCNTR